MAKNHSFFRSWMQLPWSTHYFPISLLHTHVITSSTMSSPGTQDLHLSNIPKHRGKRYSESASLTRISTSAKFYATKESPWTDPSLKNRILPPLKWAQKWEKLWIWWVAYFLQSSNPYYLTISCTEKLRDIFWLYSYLYDVFNVTFLHKGLELINT